MTTTPVDSATWEKLANNEGLSKDEEIKVFHHIWRGGSFGETKKVADALKRSSDHFREKSMQQMIEVVNNLKKGMLFNGALGLDKMVKSELTAASRLAQANRLENEAIKTTAGNLKPIDIKTAFPKVPMYRDFPPTFAAQPSSGFC